MANDKGAVDHDRPLNSIGYLLRRAHKMATQCAEDAFAGEELNFTQWIALIQLREGLIDTHGALARCIGHDSGATTRLLDQLEGRGLLKRRRSTTDRRVIHLELTPAGIGAATRLLPHMASLWSMLLDDFDEAEVMLLRSLLLRLTARLDRVDGQRRLA